MQGIVHIDDSPTSKQAGAWWHTTSTTSSSFNWHIETVKELIDIYSQEDLNKLDRSCAL